MYVFTCIDCNGVYTYLRHPDWGIWICPNCGAEGAIVESVLDED